MKVRVDKFCSLSTSPSWQAWLFHFDVPLYRRFMKQLQESRGCGQNRDIMVELLKEIDKVPGGADRLFTFLKQHYPNMLVKEDAEPTPRAVPSGEVFPYFNPGLLTYPRRQIFTGANLQKQVAEFLLDKLKSDSVVVGDTAYVEYLERGDAALADKIPAKNWLIAAWRLKA